MAVYEINPLSDTRWPAFLQAHPNSSVFHTVGWLEALHATYGHTPTVITTTPSDRPLRNGIVLCRVKSWLTGARLVSLPFSDHCEPLVENHEEFIELLAYTSNRLGKMGAKYLELRPKSAICSAEGAPASVPGETFFLHTLDLQPASEVLLRNSHKSCIQRKVQRANREGLTVQVGTSSSELEAFYKLLLLTRRRHQLPPQPIEWFRNLISATGDSLKIRLACKDGQPVAGIVTMSHKQSELYKYGASDAAFHSLGVMPFILWDAIVDAKNNGATEFDFGRSDRENDGLVAFKDNWGATRSELEYRRYGQRVSASRAKQGSTATLRKAFSMLPDVCFTTAGRILYRHIG